MENKNFRKLISHIQSHPKFQEYLPIAEKNHSVKIYKITELNLSSIVTLYTVMQKKFYINRKASNQEAWYQNQLRIFVWLLFGYLYVFQKNLEELNDDDWNFFSPIFNYKRTIFFQFQSRSLLKTSGRPVSWTLEQTDLLETIIQKKTKNQWNSIARQLFIRSGKRFFRNPKQCRERWMNHLDPKKIHTEWTAAQDLILLNSIKKRGKKWSSAVKQLSNTRTQHMVKNRYKSLILNKSKEHPGKKEFQIENLLIKKLEKIVDKQSKIKKEEIKIEQISQIEGQYEDKKINLSFKDQFQNYSDKKPQFEEEYDRKYVKEEEKIKSQSNSPQVNFSQNMFSDFSQFGQNTLLFIPWQNNNGSHPFDLRHEQISQEENFSPNLSLEDGFDHLS